MILKNKLKFMFGIVFIALLMTGQTSRAATSDTVDGFEENDFLMGIDLWINQSTSVSMQPLGLSGVTSQTWELAHYFLLPQSVNLANWIIFDTEAIFKIGFLWKRSGYVSGDYNYGVSLGLSDGENKTETGLSDIEGAGVNNFVQKDANSIVTNRDDNSIPNIDMTWDKLQESTGFASHEANYTVPENTVRSGVVYQAGDSKTTWEYATDVAESEGRTLIGIANASMIGFAYESFDSLQAVAITFDQERAVSSGQPIGMNNEIYRTTAWGKSKEAQTNAYTGQIKTRTDLNIFRDIKTINSQVVGVPNDALKGFKEPIPQVLHGVAKLGFGALVSGLKKSGKLLLTIGLILGAVILIAIVIRRNKSLK